MTVVKDETVCCSMTN